MKLTKNLDQNIKMLREYFGIDKTFDIVEREILIGDTKCYMLMIDGLVQDEMLLNIINRMQMFSSKDLKKKDFHTYFKKSIGYSQVEPSTDFNQLETMMLSGTIILFFDGIEEFLIIDARQFPIRSPEEPELEKVTRGPRDGFVETLMFNIALIRRRVIDPKLRAEIKTVGSRSKTDLCICYLDDKVDKELLTNILNKIDAIDVEAIVMAEKTISELIMPRQWFNPLPQVRYTERPDVAAAHLFEGHLLVITDTSPSVIILPTTVWHFTQHAEDYYHVPVVGTYLRQLRMFAIVIAYIGMPLWYIFILYRNELPDFLEIVRPDEIGDVPIFIQILALELGVDLLRISSIHTPASLSTSLGIVGGLVLGNYAIEAGWFSGQAILVMAVVSICTFAIPSNEFAMGIRMLSLFVLIATFLFGHIGFIVANIIVLLIVIMTRNGSNVKFTYPLIPFNFKHLMHVLFRFPLPPKKKN